MTRQGDVGIRILICLLNHSGYLVSVFGQNVLSPASVYQWEEMDVNLTCTCTCLPTNVEQLKYVIWHRENANMQGVVTYETSSCNSKSFLTDSSRYSYGCSQEMFYLTLKNISLQNDNDIWTCVTGPWSVKSNSVTIKVKVPVRSLAINASKILTLNENSKIFLRCTTSPCRPVPRFQWFLVSSETGNPLLLKTIEPTSEVSTVQEFHSYFSTVTNRSLSGWSLYCAASNNINVTTLESTKVKLDVLYPPSGQPRVQNLNTSISVIETRLYNMTCLIDESNPATRVSWSCADGESLVQDLTPNRGVLIWRSNRTMESTCTCNANYRNSSRGSLKITINTLYPASIIRMYLNDTAQTSQMTVIRVVEHSTLSIKYDTDGNPSPTVVWYPLNTTSSVLTLSDVQRTPSNTVYVFHASNILTDSFGHSIRSDVNKTITIDVLYPPTLRYDAVVTMQEGETIIEPCLETNGAVSNLTVFWQTNDGKTKFDYYLRIRNVSRNAIGCYTCMVNYTLYPTYGKAISGSLVKKLFLNVQEKPIAKCETGRETVGSSTGAIVGGTFAGALIGAIATVLVMYFVWRRKLFEQKGRTAKRQEHETILTQVGEPCSSTFETSNAYEGLASKDSQDHKYQDLKSLTNRQDSKIKTYENLQMAQ